MCRNISCRNQLILVGGETGSGKSTFARLLSRKLGDCLIIEGDYFMKQSFREKEQELQKEISNVEFSEDGHIKARSFYSCQEDFDKALNVILPCMDSFIIDEIQNNSKYKYIIVEWSHVHSMSIWDKACWRFCVTASDDLKEERLLGRDEDAKSSINSDARKRIKNKIVTGRVTVLDDNVHFVENNGSIEDLSRKADMYASVISQDRRVVFLAGQHGCGKTYVSEYLSNIINDLFTFDCGPEMRRAHRESGDSGELHNWIEENNKKNGELFTERMIVDRFVRRFIMSNCSVAFIVGVRSMEHIRLFCEQLQIPDFSIIYLDCVSNTRANRIKQREGGSVTDEMVEEMDTHDQHMGLGGILEYVKSHQETCHIVENSGTNVAIVAREIVHFLESATSVKVSWSKVSGATGYEVFRATVKDGTYSKLGTVTGTSRNCVNLTAGKTYYFKVRAYKEVNGEKIYGSYSTIVSAVPKK